MICFLFLWICANTGQNGAYVGNMLKLPIPTPDPESIYASYVQIGQSNQKLQQLP